MIYEDLPSAPRADELRDSAFSRAARAGRAKQGREAQESMVRTACTVVADNLENVVRQWPDLDEVDPFYREIGDAVLRRETDPRRGDEDGDDGDGAAETAGIDALRQSLSTLTWASRHARDLRGEYLSKVRDADEETARKHRKQAFARVSDVLDEIADDLRRVGDARDALRDLPDIRADEPTVVVAGYPNVGKSTLVNAVTRASNETAAYPFTTRAVRVGHLERDRIRYQVVDTPGLLDRPAAERNEIERQATSALAHLADAVLVLVDPSEACGYPLADQLALRDEIAERFDAPVRTVGSKSDRSTAVDADVHVSVAADENVEQVVDLAVEAVDHEPDVPPSRY